MTVDNLCNSCINLGCEFQSGIVRSKCAFYIPPHIESDNYVNHVIQDSTTKNDLGVDCISRTELLKAMDTWDKFGYTARYGLERLDKDDKGFVPYVKYEDMVNCVKGMPSVTQQEPKTGHWKNVPYEETLFEETLFCSECNLQLVDEQTYIPLHYCPNCGAKMED